MVEATKHAAMMENVNASMQRQCRLQNQQQQQQQPPIQHPQTKVNPKNLQALSVSHQEQFKIESEAILASTASTSHAVFGNFALNASLQQIRNSGTNQNQNGHQVAMLRSMNTIELYKRTQSQNLELICKYEMPNARCLSMQKVTIDSRKSLFEPQSQVEFKHRNQGDIGERAGRGYTMGDIEEDIEDYPDVRTKDLLVVHIPELKFLILEFDPRINEFSTYSIFNFDPCEELKITGKRFPTQGFLRTISSESTSLQGFGFLADDSLFCWVQFQEVQEMVQATGAKGGLRKKVGMHKQQVSSLELTKKQSSQMWNELRENDEGDTQGVVSSVWLSEKYMNVMSGDPHKVSVKNLVKPLEFFQLDKFGIHYVVDMQLVEQRTSQTVLLLVLFKGDIDKMVGTKARYPVTRLAIFQLQGSGLEPTLVEEQPKREASKYPQYAEQASTQPQSSLLKYMMTMEALPLYANRILTTATATDDYCYLVTPYSLCLVRLESNRVTEIFTSSLGITIKEKFNKDPNKMFFPEQTSTERSMIEENSSQELKLDGTAKIMSLPGHRLLVLNEQGDYTIISIRFDQAEIDVAEAVFQKIESEERMTASSLCFTPVSNDTENSDFDIFASSHFHDATLMRLKTVKDSDKIAELEQKANDGEVEKRQRTNSEVLLNANFMRRKKSLIYYEPLTTSDSLPTVSPVCDAAQIPSIAGYESKGPRDTQFSMDFLIGSGNHVKSYLTFAASSVPLMESPMSLSQLLPADDLTKKDFKVLRVMSEQDYIFVNYKVEGLFKTSAIRIDPKNKKPTQLKEDKLKIDFNQETLLCCKLDLGQMLQVCPQSIRIVTSKTECESSVINEIEYSAEAQTLSQACLDQKTKTLFIVKQSEMTGHCQLQAWQSVQLIPAYVPQLSQITSSVSAVSVTQQSDNLDKASLLCVATKASQTKQSELLIYEIKDCLNLIFKCANVNEQLPILPNQLFQEHYNLTQLAMTDLSVDLGQTLQAANQGEHLNQTSTDQRIFASSDHNAAFTPAVKEVKLWFSEALPTRPILFLILADGSVLMYQSFFEFDCSEKLRFKLVDSHVLVKPRASTNNSLDQNLGQQALVHLEPKMAMVLHPCKPIAVFIRNGMPICIDVGKQQASSLVSLAPFMTGFLAIKSERNSVKTIRFPSRFDPRSPSVKLCDGYLLKQLLFKDKGIKKVKVFSPYVVTSTGHVAPQHDQPPPEKPELAESRRDYIFLATYQHTVNNEGSGNPRGSADFTPQTKAQSIKYALNVIRMPKADKTWKEFADSFLMDGMICEPYQQDNQVINELEQVTLRSTEDDYRNYLAVASVKIDTSLQRGGPRHQNRQDDEGFYSSSLNIYQVDWEQKKLKLCFTDLFKRSITCIASYLGNLIATLKALKLQDLVFFMYKFNEQESKLTHPTPLPNGIQNLATSISFDGDFIIIGDAYKNLNLLKKCDEEDNKQEKQEQSGLINFKKVMSNKIEAKVIGAHSLNKKLAMRDQDQAKFSQKGVMSYERIVPLTEIQKKMFTVMSASFDGYVRLYKIKETKNLEIVAQLNVMDKILTTVPLQLNLISCKDDDECENLQIQSKEEHLLTSIQERKLAIVTQRSGILIASSCTELEFRAQKSLVELMSRILPHRGCLTPMHSHFTPATVFQEKSSVYERTNSNAINYSKTLHAFYFLTATQKRNIAGKIGFSVAKLEQFITQQRQLVSETDVSSASTTNNNEKITKPQ